MAFKKKTKKENKKDEEQLEDEEEKEEDMTDEKNLQVSRQEVYDAGITQIERGLTLIKSVFG